MNFPRIWFGNFTTPGHGNWPGTMHIQARSQPMPKLDGFSLFCACFCSANTCSLRKGKINQKYIIERDECFETCILMKMFEVNYLDLPIIRKQCERISSFFLLSTSISSSFPSSANIRSILFSSDVNKNCIHGYCIITYHKSIL